MKKILYLLTILFLGVSAFAAEKSEAVIVCDNGLEMFAWDLDFVANANQSIEITSPFFGGKIARDLLAALDQRIQERPDLQVHLLFGPMFLEDRDTKMIKDLEEKFPENFHALAASEVAVSSPDLTSIGNHVKVFIVDEHYYAVGGTNLDEGLCTDGTYTPPRKPKSKIGPLICPAGGRDGDVVARGALAKPLREMFFKLYAIFEDYEKTKRLIADPDHFAGKTRYFLLDEAIEKPFAPLFESSDRVIVADKVEMYFSGSMDVPHNKVTNAYAKLLQEAKKSVIIGNLYFNPPKQIYKALMGCVNRGIEMRVITNGVHEGITPEYNDKFCWANRMSYVPLFYGREYHMWEAFKAGSAKQKKTQIYEYIVPDVVYHKKAMVVDDDLFVVGSYNFGTKSDSSDYELILVIESKEIAAEALRVFQVDVDHSVEIRSTEARSWYFNPWYSYLGYTQRLFHTVL